MSARKFNKADQIITSPVSTNQKKGLNLASTFGQKRYGYQVASSIFISRIRGLPVLDGVGDQVGKVRDVVLQVIIPGRAPRAKGLVVELFARQRIFVPMARIHAFDPQEVIITGVVDTRRFSRRQGELLVFDDLFDRNVTTKEEKSARVYDVSIRPGTSREWVISEVALSSGSRTPFSKPHVWIVDWVEINDLGLVTSNQATAQLVALLETMKPADIARELHDLEPQRRAEVLTIMTDEALANALEEMPEDEQVELISELEVERAADVLEEMDPDDAADLIADLEPMKAEDLLARMEPEDAADVRKLLNYAEETAGGMMTPEPVILSADATVAEALASIREPELTPALACTVFVCRPPLTTPTGRYLGGVHFQRLLREPPSQLVGAFIDDALEPIPAKASLAEVSRYFATYNLVIAPVVDADGRLVGAVTVDDVLDHMLPEDWRGIQMDGEEAQ